MIDQAEKKNLKACVNRGASMLDERIPGWADMISLKTLDLDKPERCVLGQLSKAVTGRNDVDYNTCRSGVSFADGCALADHQELNFSSMDDALDHGFSWLLSDPTGWAYLNKRWTKEIGKRQKGDHS